jgi:CubicO group peptidase (beta-lactamase class C family)
MTATTMRRELAFLVPFVGLILLAAPRVTQGQPARSSELTASAAQLPQLRSLLVSRRGQIVSEYYAKGVRPTSLANIKSASKSLISTLVGVAIDRGLIKGLREPIVSWYPELRQDKDPRKQRITIEDLLTMRSGLESTSGRNYGRWVQSPNWVRFALTRPMVASPGDAMQYSTGSSHLLSGILTKVTGVSTWQFANDALARPLGFTLARWPTDGQGIYFGGNEMLFTPMQMVSVGELYLHRGLVNGKQVVPAAWVDTSCVPRTESVFDGDRKYGYGWWMQEFQGGSACFAWGFGGQYIMVFRDLDLVVVATSSTAVNDDRFGYRRQLFELIELQVLAPLRAASVAR